MQITLELSIEEFRILHDLIQLGTVQYLGKDHPETTKAYITVLNTNVGAQITKQLEG